MDENYFYAVLEAIKGVAERIRNMKTAESSLNNIWLLANATDDDFKSIESIDYPPEIDCTQFGWMLAKLHATVEWSKNPRLRYRGSNFVLYRSLEQLDFLSAPYTEFIGLDKYDMSIDFAEIFLGAHEKNLERIKEMIEEISIILESFGSFTTVGLLADRLKNVRDKLNSLNGLIGLESTEKSEKIKKAIKLLFIWYATIEAEGA